MSSTESHDEEIKTIFSILDTDIQKNDYFSKKLLRHQQHHGDQAQKSSAKKKPNEKNSKLKFIQFCTIIFEIQRKISSQIQGGWSYLFYRRMVINEDLQQPEKIQIYLLIVSLFLNSISKKKDTIDYICALTFEEFLSKHLLDPDNSIIGLQPKVEVFTDFYERTSNGYRMRHVAVSSLVTSSMNSSNPSSSSSSSSSSGGMNTSSLVGSSQKDHIHKKLGPMSSSSSLFPASPNSNFVSPFSPSTPSASTSASTPSSPSPSPSPSTSASSSGSSSPASSSPSLQNSISLRPGDIAIYINSQVTPPIFNFIRVQAIDENKSLALVFMTPQESSAHPIPFEKLLQLHPQLEELIQQGNVRSMYKIIYDPLDDLFDEITEQSRKKLLNYLMVSDNTINQIVSPTIESLPLINQFARKLEKTRDYPPEGLYQSLDREAKKQIVRFAENPPPGMFIPHQKKSITSLLSIQLSQLAKNRVNVYLGNCNSGLDQLKIEKKLLMNGERKNELTKWWLTFIDRECEAFLLRKTNFNLSAIPDNYIDHPPDDLPAIKQNLKDLEIVLNYKEDRFQIKEFITTLSKKIYTRIDKFINQAKIVLSEQFGIESELNLAAQIFTPVLLTTPISLLKEKFDSQKDSIEGEIRTWIDNMIKDIEYLEEMKQMEEEQERQRSDNGGSIPSTKGLILSKVVPVSGLIINFFYRMENVHRTILELWDHRVVSTPAKPEQNSPQKADLAPQQQEPPAAPPAHQPPNKDGEQQHQNSGTLSDPSNYARMPFKHPCLEEIKSMSSFPAVYPTEISETPKSNVFETLRKRSKVFCFSDPNVSDISLRPTKKLSPVRPSSSSSSSSFLSLSSRSSSPSFPFAQLTDDSSSDSASLPHRSLAMGNRSNWVAAQAARFPSSPSARDLAQDIANIVIEKKNQKSPDRQSAPPPPLPPPSRGTLSLKKQTSTQL